MRYVTILMTSTMLIACSSDPSGGRATSDSDTMSRVDAGGDVMVQTDSRAPDVSRTDTAGDAGDNGPINIEEGEALHRIESCELASGPFGTPAQQWVEQLNVKLEFSSCAHYECGGELARHYCKQGRTVDDPPRCRWRVAVANVGPGGDPQRLAVCHCTDQTREEVCGYP